MEEMLEFYLSALTSLGGKFSNLRMQIQSAEELVALRLDTSRNELLIVNTLLSGLSCSIAIGAYVTGVFGMNLDNVNTIQPMVNSFPMITIISFGTMLLAFATLNFLFYHAKVFPTRAK